MTELIAIITITLLAVISPGPDFAMVTRNSLLLSRRAGLLTALGIGAGVLVHVTYALIGVGLLIQQSPWLFNAIKLIGAVYLIYLGAKMLRARPADVLNESAMTPLSDAAALRTGFLTNALNPKTSIFIVSVFMQVVRPDTPLVVQIGYGVFIFIVHVAWFALVAQCLSAGAVRERLLVARHWIDRAFGGLLVGFGILLAVTFAASEQRDIKTRIQGEPWMLVPIAFVVSGLLVGVIYRVFRQRLSISAKIAIGIRRGEFLPFYQPIIDLQTGSCVGAEALVRWQRPDGSLAEPHAFIVVAEECGLVTGITDQLINRVVNDLGHILALNADAHVAINLYAQDIESGRFLPVLAHALECHEVDPSHIWLEVTERGVIDADAARETLCGARARGCVIAIDDFGTGYSSLSMLEQLPLDALKIDKSFVDAIGRNAAKNVVVQHIVEMANELKLTVVAEGIETSEQAAYLRAAGARYGQGWLFAKAMPLAEFLDYLKQGRV